MSLHDPVHAVHPNDKSHDAGSDLSRLRRLGVPVAYDQTPDHMHHKFALFDGSLAVSGSDNWTRSAAERNEENIVVTSDLRLTSTFQRRFDELCKQLS